jgi:hypothetical protein
MGATVSIPRSAVRFQRVVIDEDGPRDPHVKAVGDINGDGVAEVVVASSAGGPLVWYEHPDWAKHTTAASGGWSTDARLVDMDGDGDVDVLISDWYTHGRLEWWENPRPKGDPRRDSWRPHVIGPPRAHDIAVGDIAGSGSLDIVTRTQGADGATLVVRTRTSEGWAQRLVPCPPGEGLALGDINGDGRLDIVIAGRWYEAPLDILTGAWREHTFAQWPADSVVRLADMTGNGRLDILMTRSEGPFRLSWFEAPSDPSQDDWLEHAVEPDIAFAHSLEVADLNGDSLPDIVTAEMHQSERRRVMVYLNRGDGRTWHRHVVAETGSHNLCAADLVGDGRIDLVGANWSGPYQPIEMWRNVP